METNKVSIIIPVFNVEMYLKECVESVIGQTYENIEIILINDGSTDTSGEMCDYFATIDSRIKVIHKLNGGLMSAWKAGLVISTGQYIGFVDSDDWIDSNMYDELVNAAKVHEADIVICHLIREVSNSTSIKEKPRLPAGVYNNRKITNEIIPRIINDGSYLGRIISPSRVTKLFRRELLEKNIQFFDEKISFGEDLVTTFSCMCDSNKIALTSDFYPYHYRINNQSIINKYDKNRIEKVMLLNETLKKIAIAKGFDIVEQIANDYISLAIWCIEDEILFAPHSKKTIISNIKKINSSEIFAESLLNGNTKRFSLKYKIYLFLLKQENYKGIYNYRRVINLIKSIRIKNLD